MADTNPPATVRSFNETDADVEVIHQPHDSVSFRPGMGDSGYKVQVVEHDCPRCDFDRMVRRVDENPVHGTEVRYWCLMPNCGHYVGNQLSHACRGNAPQFIVREPTEFEGVEA